MQQIIQCDRKDLEASVRTILNEFWAIAQSEAEQKAKELLLTKEETTNILKISNTTAWRWAKAGYLVPIYIGGKCRYRMADVQQIISDAKVANM